MRWLLAMGFGALFLGCPKPTDQRVVVVNDPSQSVPVSPPPVQAVGGTVDVGNFPATQAVSGEVSVTNLPASQAVTGTVAISNLPATQNVAGTLAVSNFPATQDVAGTLAVSNFPATQNVAGTVTIGNFPSTQAVTGTVTTNPIPFGIHNSQTFVTGAAPLVARTGNFGAHAVMLHWSVTAEFAPVQPSTAIRGIVTLNLSPPVSFVLPLPSYGSNGTVATEHFGQSSGPLYVPANTDYRVELEALGGVTGTFTGLFSFSGVNLN